MNAAKKDHDGLTSWWGVREVDFLFGKFKRYTRFVLYGKWSLVSIALILVAALIIWPLVGKDKSGLRVSFVDSKSVPQPPTSPVMNSPVYRGNSANGREYKVSGEKATQQSPTLVIVDKVEAVMMKPDGGWQILTADQAHYLQNERKINLSGHVVVVDSGGNEFTTERATIDTATMDVTGDAPVTGNGTSGIIVASGFEIRDNGERIAFHKGDEQIRVTLKQAARKP